MPLIDGIDQIKPNRINNWAINGRMDIWQRGTATTATTNTTPYLADRWACTNGTDANISLSRITSVPTLATPLKYAFRIQPASTDTMDPGDFIAAQYTVEGYDLLRFFNKKMHVYFWARSNLTGTFCVNASNAGDRTYAATYTINVANTWEFKHVVIPWDTQSGGTWNFTNLVGTYLWWGLACHSSFQAAPNVWNVGDFVGVTGMNNTFMSSTSNTFDLAGVVMYDEHLTDAEYLLALNSVSHDEDLLRCQRYYQKTYDLEVIPGTGASQSGAFRLQMNYPLNPWIWTPLQKRMRTAPTVVFYNPNTGTAGQGEIIGSGTFSFGGLQSGEVNISYNLVGVNSGDFIRWHTACEAEL